MAVMVLIMKFAVHLLGWILEIGPSLDSMPELHVVHVLMILHAADFWVSQVRITDLIHEQIPVHFRRLVITGLLDAE